MRGCRAQGGANAGQGRWCGARGAADKPLLEEVGGDAERQGERAAPVRLAGGRGRWEWCSQKATGVDVAVVRSGVVVFRRAKAATSIEWERPVRLEAAAPGGGTRGRADTRAGR